MRSCSNAIRALHFYEGIVAAHCLAVSVGGRSDFCSAGRRNDSEFYLCYRFLPKYIQKSIIGKAVVIFFKFAIVSGTVCIFFNWFKAKIKVPFTISIKSIIGLEYIITGLPYV